MIDVFRLKKFFVKVSMGFLILGCNVSYTGNKEGLIKNDSRGSVDLNQDLVPNIWDAQIRKNLTYKFDGFNEEQEVIIKELFNIAISDYEKYIDIDFIDVTDTDRDALFFVSPRSTYWQYLYFNAFAYSTFPNDENPHIVFNDRKILKGQKNPSNFFKQDYATQLYIVRHELGHMLGLRHENIWDENGNQIGETSSPAKLITDEVDTSSIMYSYFLSSYTGDKGLTSNDIFTLQELYSGRNLIKNGYFHDSMKHWSPFVNVAGNAEFDVKDGKFIAKVYYGGGEAWMANVCSNNFKLESGKKYEVSFTASSIVDREIEVKVCASNSPWTTYSEKEYFELGGIEKKYSFAFVANNPANEDLKLEFGLGTANGKVSIDNVILVEVK